jgi:hypothetical protein
MGQIWLASKTLIKTHRNEGLKKMKKILVRHSNKLIATATVLAILVLFLTNFSLIEYPFLNPRASLNGHLKKDFGLMLPTSAVIEQSYWVGSHDPENVFKIELEAKDIGPFIDAIRAAALKMKYRTEDVSENNRFWPLYGKPIWWNNPPLADGVKLEMTIPVTDVIMGNYRFLYSPSTGMLYLVWGTN